jgi:predicted phage terminase large subunit-like protein
MYVNYKRVFSDFSSKIKKEYNDFELWNAIFVLIRDIPSSPLKWELTGKLKAEISKYIKKAEIKTELEELLRETLLCEARGLRFDSYMQYIELLREPQKKFWLPRRKQLLPVCNAIQELIDDKLDILTVSLPPGSGKSTLEIFLHSMMIGANPDKPSLASGHSGILTNSIYDGVLGIISDPYEYLWSDIFPKAGEIITNAKEQTIDLGKKHRFSSLTCRAIGASLTGATRCEQFLTADDLVSGIEEALSVPRLEKLWQSYTNDLKSRKKLGCKELHLATRWSVHDPIGKLQTMYENSEDVRFKCLVVPALDENGESNFDYDYGVGFDTKYFREMEESLDEASFKALFMNQPIEREGLLYPPESLNYYYSLPEEEPDGIIAVCDTKDRGKDYCVLPVAYIYGQNYYIEDVICDNSLPEIVDKRLVEILCNHNVQRAHFESNAAGGRIANDVEKALKAKNKRCSVSTKYTTQTKETKIIVNSGWIKEHCFFKEDFSRNTDYGRFMNMMCSYTQIGKNEHDDAPDAMAMLAEFVTSMSLTKVEVFKRPF